MRKLSIIPVIIIIIAAFLFINRGSSGDLFPLPELGVRIRTDAVLQDLAYEAATADKMGTALHMKASSIVVEGRQCELGTLYKLSESVVESGETPWTKERITAALEEQNDMPPLAKKLDDGYLVFEPSQSACALIGDQDTLEKEGQKRKALWKAVSTAEKNG